MARHTPVAQVFQLIHLRKSGIGPLIRMTGMPRWIVLRHDAMHWRLSGKPPFLHQIIDPKTKGIAMKPGEYSRKVVVSTPDILISTLEPLSAINNETAFVSWMDNELQKVFPHGAMFCALGINK